MPKKKPLPRHCLVVRRYDELRQLVRAFAQGMYELMCLLGGPGIGKSETVRRIMREVLGPTGWGLITGKHTPLDLYERLYRFRAVSILLDDLDDLLRRPDNVVMLKCLCETSPVKTVQWGSNHPIFNGNLPQSFESVSRLCLVANDWNYLDRNIAAVHDRGPVVFFQPNALEVHRELAEAGWFPDEEVFTFVGQNLFLVNEPSFRLYKAAYDHKRAGLDWRDITLRTLENCADPKLVLVAKLLSDQQYDALATPEAARVQAFAAEGGGSRATYFRYKNDLLARRGTFRASDVAAIKLRPSKPDLHYLALLERREQIEQLRDESDRDFPPPRPDSGGDPPRGDAHRLSQLRREMQAAIAKEEYERAARLRDEIQQLERNSGNLGNKPQPDM